ncbi:MAG: hypothetical protein ACREGG_01180 [Candidatus Saccharimonadales bacterium]
MKTTSLELTKEQKAEKRQTRNEAIAAVAIFGGGFGLAGTAAGLEASGVWKVPSDHAHNNPPVEKHGDHHGSTGMPSTEHLNKFAAEHSIHLNQK